MTRVSGSSTSASISSVSVRSAWLPRLAYSEKPMPCSRDPARVRRHGAPPGGEKPGGRPGPLGSGRGVALRLTHREDGARRRADHTLGDAAEEQPVEAAAPVRAEDDQVGLLLLRRLDDLPPPPP